jgi:glycogen debranching enzyme
LTTEDRPAGGGFRLLKDGRLRLLTDGAGAIGPDERGQGLYLADTRFLCRLELTVAGRQPIAEEPPDEGLDPGTADQITLAIGGRPDLRVIRRRIVATVLTESVSLASDSSRSRRVELRLRIGFDAADIFEIRGYRRPAPGHLQPVRVDGSALRFAYVGRDNRVRRLAVTIDPEPGGPPLIGTARRGRELTATIRWLLVLRPGSTTTLRWTLEPSEAGIPGRWARPAVRRRPAGASQPAEAGVEVDDPTIQRVLDRALADLHLLAEDGPRPGQRIIAAGLPWFAALFGRDSLLTAYEAIAFRPDLAVDALAVLAERQAQDGDPHGGEPGQILHELRTGEMARLGEVPFGPSFGSVDATPLWLVLLGEANDWLADQKLIDRLWPVALRALDWLDVRVRVGRDGFLGYAGRPGALANEGWKDSPDSVRDHAGAVVPAPIALAEVQGYVHDAWRRMARLATSRGETGLAGRLNRRAARLRVRFGPAFWVAERGFPAMALGAAGRVADAIASNPGQCLWSGILERGMAAAVAARLLAPDMDSGWGIRTLAASELAFDPLGYHTGSVWPHDTALIVGGLKRAGFDDAARQVADHLLQAAAALPGGRLPELVSGEQRRTGVGPGVVPEACLIQAWASAAPLHLVRVLLGLEPQPPSAQLVLRRPDLPSSIGLIRIRGLAVGSRRMDLEVSRRRGGLRARAIGGDRAIRLNRIG